MLYLVYLSCTFVVFIELNACSPNPCKHGAVCINQRIDYVCPCPAGYAGKNCEISKLYLSNQMPR